ncbi:MAG: phage minor head protein, partial [Ktedonobacteraceae bacterium]
LRAREAQAEQALNDAHQHTLRMIQSQLEKLYREIAAKQALGEIIPASWLYERGRLATLKQLIEGQIDHYTALAQMQAAQLQHMALDLGKRAAMDQLHATIPAGVKWAFGLPSQQAITDIIGVTRDGSPLADLFAGFGKEAAQKASDALIMGITNGDNPRVVAKYVQHALDVSRQRALVISQNEMVRAYRSANLETMRANSDVVSGWVWSANLGSACLACTEENGSVHPLDEEMASHVRCECVPVPQTRSWSDILDDAGIDTSALDIPETSIGIQDGSEWFARQSVATQQQILGSKARYQAYQNGTTLKQMVGKKHNERWGGSIYIRPMKDLVKR